MKKIYFIGITFKIAITSWIVFGSISTYAQHSLIAKKSNVFFGSIHNQQKANSRIAQNFVPGLRMRNLGRGMVICGGLLHVGALVMIIRAYSNPYEGNVDGLLGLAALGYGVAATTTGTILWSRGQGKYNRYRKLQSFKLNINGLSLALRYKF